MLLHPQRRSRGRQTGGSARVSSTSIISVADTDRTRYHLNGWAPENPLYAAQASDATRYLANYQSLARELAICLVPGTIVEKHTVHPADPDADAQTKDVFYNTAYFIAPSGDILGSYRKKNLWLPERQFLTGSGDDPHQVFDTPVGRVGMLVCWDIAFPEAFRELVSRGVELVIVPTFCMSFVIFSVFRSAMSVGGC